MSRKFSRRASRQVSATVPDDYTALSVPDAATVDIQIKVIVIGAGISGITAARYLLDRADGVEVTVLEANPERYGGRTWSFEVPGHPGKPVDLGGAWIHEYTDQRNPIARYCREHGIATQLHHYLPDNIQAFVDGPNVNDIFAGKDAEKEMYKAWDVLADLDDLGVAYQQRPNQSDRPVLEALVSWDPDLRQRYNQMEPHTKDFLHYFIEDEEGNSCEMISARMIGFMFGEIEENDVEDRTRDHILPGGYKMVLDSVVTVRLGHKVNSVSVEGDTVVVGTERGDIYQADFVVVTVPLGVLKAKHIQFSPPLPDEQLLAIDRMGFGNFVKILLVFDKVFWPSNKDWIYFFPGKEHPHLPRIYFVNMHAVNKLPALVGVLVGKYAYQADHMTTDDVARQAMGVLQLIYPSEWSSAQPRVTFAKKTNWRTDHLSLGCYSHGGIGMEVADVINVRLPLCSRVFFAGEHTAYGEGVSASVTVAFMSGVRAAKHILQELAAAGGASIDESVKLAIQTHFADRMTVRE